MHFAPMDDKAILNAPPHLAEILAATHEQGFSMASDNRTGALLQTLAASKPGGMFLELGTGTGLSAAWILSGLDKASRFWSVDNDEEAQAVARRFLEGDTRARFVCGDGGAFVENWNEGPIDFIFADTWPGKYTHLSQTLALLKPGGFYVVDDMLPQANWPPEHFPKVPPFIERLETDGQLSVVKLGWSTGLIVAVKRA